MSTTSSGAPASRPSIGGEGASWKLMMTMGILVSIAGILAIAVPAAASVSIAVFIGILLLCAGVVTGIGAFRAETAAQGVLSGVLGLLMIVAGGAVIADPEGGTITLTLILALWFFASGVVRLVYAIRARDVIDHAGMVGFGGGLSIVLGVLIANHLPSSAAWAIGLLVGIELLAAGALLMSLAFALKRASTV